MSEKRAYFHSLATSRFQKELPPHARPGSRRVVAAHVCAHEWNSWIRWRCTVGGATRRARRRNDLVYSPFDRASRVLNERCGSAARRQRLANERSSIVYFDRLGHIPYIAYNPSIKISAKHIPHIIDAYGD